MSADIGFHVKGVTHSPLLGADGNVEFFLWLAKEKSEDAGLISSEEIQRVVETAHEVLLEKRRGKGLEA